MARSHADVRAGLQNAATAVLTPFDDQGDIEYDHLAANTEFIEARGIRLLLASANVSEYHSLTHEERIETVATVTDAVSPETTVLGGVGGSRRSAQELAQAHAENDVDALMVMPPDNAFVHEEGLCRYYEDLGATASLPLVPYIRGLNLTAETIAEIADLSSVVGMKYALDDVTRFSRAVALADDETVWLPGMGEPPVPAYWLEGARGFTSGVGNFEPAIGLALMDALQAGNWRLVRRIRNATFPIQRLRSGTGTNNQISDAVSVPVLKECLSLAGGHGGYVRDPLVELDEATRERVHQAFDQVETFVDEVLDREPARDVIV